MRHYWMRVVTTAAVAAVTLVAPATPAHATITGQIDFICTADLPLWPHFSGSGTCGFVGPIPGQAVVTASGVDALGHAYVVGGTGPFRAVFNYSDPCPAVAPVPPPVGNAYGTASITGLTAIDQGVVVSARFDTNFEWVRFVGDAVFVTTNSHFTFSNGHVAFATMTDSGTASFTPLPVPGNCAGPAPTRAVVAGTDYLLL